MFVGFVAGVEGNQEKWKDCVSDTESVLGFAIGSMFVRNAFHGESKTKAATMVHEVREAFKNNLPNLPWMDDVTRQRSVEKVQYIKSGSLMLVSCRFTDFFALQANAVMDMIGYPDYILDDTQLDEKYQDVSEPARSQASLHVHV